MEGHLLMSAKERERLVVLSEVEAGRLKLKEASVKLGLSYRHAKRVYKAFREEGAGGLVHGNRGRPSPRAYPDSFKGKVLSRCRERYEGFGPTLAAEKLADEGLEVDHETLRRWLMADGQWKRRRKGRKHRTRRERKAHFGELLQKSPIRSPQRRFSSMKS